MNFWKISLLQISEIEKICESINPISNFLFVEEFRDKNPKNHLIIKTYICLILWKIFLPQISEIEKIIKSKNPFSISFFVEEFRDKNPKNHLIIKAFIYLIFRRFIFAANLGNRKNHKIKKSFFQFPFCGGISRQKSKKSSNH